jgi:hypothetical protein
MFRDPVAGALPPAVPNTGSGMPAHPQTLMRISLICLRIEVGLIRCSVILTGAVMSLEILTWDDTDDGFCIVGQRAT